jgi:hypothetical protein
MCSRPLLGGAVHRPRSPFKAVVVNRRKLAMSVKELERRYISPARGLLSSFEAVVANRWKRAMSVQKARVKLCILLRYTFPSRP